MILLKRIFSEPKTLFDEVKFKRGINVILGVYSKKTKEKSDVNGVGKSTLIRLIDFTLLSNIGKIKYFNFKNPKVKFLEGFSVILEFEAFGEIYYIKRSFDNPDEPEFGNTVSKLDKFEISDLRRILGKIFFGNQEFKGDYDNIWFRNLIKFFIKDDLISHEREDPLKFTDKSISQFTAYKYNLFLMNIPNSAISDYNENMELKRKLDDRKKTVEKTLKDTEGKEIEKINAEIQTIESKIKQLEHGLKDFSFIKPYEEIENELVMLSSDISSKLKELNILERRLNEYNESYKIDIEFNKDRIVRLYNSVKKTFGDIIKKSLDDVINFRENLTTHRRNFIRNREKKLVDNIEMLKEDISRIEKKRTELFKHLNEQKAFDSIQNAYSLLVEQKGQLEKLRAVTSQLDQLDKQITEKQSTIANDIININQEIGNAKEKINNLVKLFLEIIDNLIHIGDIEDAVFNIRPDSAMNSPLKITIKIPKEFSLGKSRLRLLIYDLTVFFNMIEQELKFPTFLIHDGMFNEIDIRTIIRTLNLIYSKTLEYPNFQYILTANEPDLFSGREEEEAAYKFKLKDSIIVVYKDNPEEMLFKREF